MKLKKENFSIKITVALTYLLMVVVNALANILPINGITSGEVSDFYENFFAPAGITFTIWGVIYILLLIYVIYQFGLFQTSHDSYRENLFKKIGFYFSLSSVLNSIWIFSWHYKIIELSLILIIGILLCLILINQHTKKANLSFKDKLFIRIPFSVYFGWLTVANVANVTTLLVKLGWNGFGISQVIWTILILIVATLIAITTILKNRDFFYGLVIIWAYVGIYIKHTSPSGYNGEHLSIITTVVVCLVFLVLSELYMLFVNKKRINTI